MLVSAPAKFEVHVVTIWINTCYHGTLWNVQPSN